MGDMGEVGGKLLVSFLIFARSFVVEASEASSSSRRSRGDFGGEDSSPARLKRGEPGEFECCEPLAVLSDGGDIGLLGLFCVRSSVFGVATSLACNGLGVGLRCVKRPSAGRENCGVARGGKGSREAALPAL